MYMLVRHSAICMESSEPINLVKLVVVYYRKKVCLPKNIGQRMMTYVFILEIT